MSIEFRPQRFTDVVDNEINNKILLSIAKNGGPSTLILNGEYGCGKTTSARLFAKAVNCCNITDDICGECDSCKCTFNNNPCYSEYDSSMFGNVDAIRDMYDDLTFVPKGKVRVITFDEAHLISRQGQSALLKVFEDAPKNIYYILCTTDKDAIQPTIVSRSISLTFNTKSKEDIVSNIKKIAMDKHIELSNGVADLIALRSKGHMRDAHKLFEKYTLIGDKDFLDLEESAYTYIAKYFAQVLWLIKNSRASADDIAKRKSTMAALVDKIMRIPITLVKDDYQRLLFDIMKKSIDNSYQSEHIVSALVQTYDAKSIMNLYMVAADEFTMSSFDSDIRFQTALYSIYQRLIYNI